MPLKYPLNARPWLFTLPKGYHGTCYRPRAGTYGRGQERYYLPLESPEQVEAVPVGSIRDPNGRSWLVASNGSRTTM